MNHCSNLVMKNSLSQQRSDLSATWISDHLCLCNQLGGSASSKGLQIAIKASMVHLQQPVPDQRSGDQEIQSFLSSIISCQPSRCDARSGAGISTSEWWWQGVHMLEEMPKATRDYFMSASPKPPLPDPTSPLWEWMVPQHVAVISAVLRSTWPYIIQRVSDDIFQFPQGENCLFHVSQNCVSVLILFFHLPELREQSGKGGEGGHDFFKKSTP